MSHSPFRLLRTSVVGATILGLAASAHLLGGGTLPAPPIMAAILALHLLCSSIATHFRLTPATMVALLASSQLILHASFETFSNAAASSAAATANHHLVSAEANASALMGSVATVSTPGMESISHLSHMSGWMGVAHVVATLAAAGLLAYGENALWSLANWLRPLYRRAAVVLVQRGPTARPTIVARRLPCMPWRNQRPNTRRGPPQMAVVLA